jgi:hypothetical protein
MKLTPSRVSKFSLTEDTVKQDIKKDAHKKAQEFAKDTLNSYF